MHILYCLGSGVKYIPFKCQPSSVQQLRARQGFKERIRMVRAKGAHGDLDDNAIALICAAALFEELTAGWTSAVEVFDQAFSMVLPGNCLVHIFICQFRVSVALVIMKGPLAPVVYDRLLLDGLSIRLYLLRD